MPQTPHETVLRHEFETVASRLARLAAGARHEIRTLFPCPPIRFLGSL
jgi:hypothetical protein